MKVATALVGIGIVAVFGYTWLHFHDRRVREMATLQRSRDSLAAAVAAERDLRASRYTADSLASLRAIRARDAALAASRATSDSLRHILGGLLDSLTPMLPDTLGDFARRILAAWAQHLGADLSERARADSALAGRDERIAQLEQTYATDLAACDDRVDEAMRQLDAALRVGRPGLLRRIVSVLPWVGGALLVGRLSR